MKRLLLTLAGLSLLGTAACSDDLLQPEPVVEPITSEASRFDRPFYTLTVLHNNDGESELLPEGEEGGVARFASVVQRVRDEISVDGRRGVVLVSSGDNFLAGPQFNASVENGVPFYDAIALDAIGYDAFAIGNHEFDFGPDVLSDFISSFDVGGCRFAAGGAGGDLAEHLFWKGKFTEWLDVRRGIGSCGAPFLSANLDVSGEPALEALRRQGRIASSTIVQLPGTRVGIIGATTPRLPFISSPRNVTVLEDVAAAVNAEMDRLQHLRVDKIILISHLQSVDEDLALIPMLKGIDVVVAGGGDELLANPDSPLIPGDVGQRAYPLSGIDAHGNMVPVVTTSGGYRYLGRLDVSFDRLGRVTGVEAGSGPIRVVGTSFPDGVLPDPMIEAQVEAPVAAAVAGLASNVIGSSEVALEGRRDPGIRTRETNLGNLVADALLWQGIESAAAFGTPVPDVALQNGGGIRNNSLIPAGAITELTTFDILPFANFVATTTVTREVFKAILENAVSRVEFVDGRFAQVAGFRFTWSPAGTPNVDRVVDVTLDDGTPVVVGGMVQPGADITVASIDFLITGGDQYPFGGSPFVRLGATYQEALEAYIEGPLAGTITAADYPEGGEGRVVRLP